MSWLEDISPGKDRTYPVCSHCYSYRILNVISEDRKWSGYLCEMCEQTTDRPEYITLEEADRLFKPELTKTCNKSSSEE